MAAAHGPVRRPQVSKSRVSRSGPDYFLRESDARWGWALLQKECRLRTHSSGEVSPITRSTAATVRWPGVRIAPPPIPGPVPHALAEDILEHPQHAYNLEYECG